MDKRPAATTQIEFGATVVGVVVGDSHACALMAAGEVRCWGGNYDGQLGNGNSNVFPAPNDAQVVPVILSDRVRPL